MLRLEDLGFSEVALNRYKKSYMKPYGALLVTGPTGSASPPPSTGLSTSSTLRTRTSSPWRTRWSNRLAGINQVQVNNKAGLTFSAGLRSILRCDRTSS